MWVLLAGGWTKPLHTKASQCHLSRLPRWLSGKESSCNARAVGLNPGSVRSPVGGHGNPLQYSFSENPVDRGDLQATVIGSQKVGHDWSNLKRMNTIWTLCFSWGDSSTVLCSGEGCRPVVYCPNQSTSGTGSVSQLLRQAQEPCLTNLGSQWSWPTSYLALWLGFPSDERMGQTYFLRWLEHLNGDESSQDRNSEVGTFSPGPEGVFVPSTTSLVSWMGI